MSSPTAGHEFHNWGDTLVAHPAQFYQPRSEADVSAIVQQTAARRGVLRVTGAGHSWSNFVLTNDTLLNLDRLDEIVKVDAERQQVTVKSGVRLKNLIPALKDHGLALKNVGSILEQSLAGAISTGTHGTGLGFGNISTQVVDLRLVTGDGTIRTVGADADLLRAARVGIGCLGVVTEVTLQCVPYHQVEFTLYSWTFEQVLANFDALQKENDRVRLYWTPPPKSILFPQTGPRDLMLVMTMNKPGSPSGVLGSAKDLIGSLPNLIADLVTDAEALLSLVPHPADDHPVKLWHCVAPYDRALTLPALPPFHQECEYAVKVESAVDCLSALQQMLKRTEYKLTLPIEIRTVAADDTMMSPSYGQAVAYIGANTKAMVDPFFTAFQEVLKDVNGRPHWGKRYTISPEEIAARYSERDRFVDYRKELDPYGVFANAEVLRLFS